MKINISWDWNLYSEKGIIRWKLPGFVYCCHEKFSPLSNIERWNVCNYLVLPCPHMLPGNECVLMIHKFWPLYRHGSRNEASNFNTESVKRELSDCTGRTRWTEICTSMYSVCITQNLLFGQPTIHIFSSFLQTHVLNLYWKT